MHQQIKQSILKVNQTAKFISHQITNQFPKKYVPYTIIAKAISFNSSKVDEPLSIQQQRQRQARMRTIIQEYDKQLLDKIRSATQAQQSKRALQVQRQNQRTKIINIELKNNQRQLTQDILQLNHQLLLFKEQLKRHQTIINQYQASNQHYITLNQSLTQQLAHTQKASIQYQYIVSSYQIKQQAHTQQLKLLQTDLASLQQQKWVLAQKLGQMEQNCRYRLGQMEQKCRQRLGQMEQKCRRLQESGIQSEQRCNKWQKDCKQKIACKQRKGQQINDVITQIGVQLHTNQPTSSDVCQDVCDVVDQSKQKVEAFSSLRYIQGDSEQRQQKEVASRRLCSKLSVLQDGEREKGSGVRDDEVGLRQKASDDFSLQNNPDTEITWTYQQLRQKYRQLKIEHDKITEYFGHLHNIHHKWKKVSTEIDHHSKINVLNKIFQRLSSLSCPSEYGEIRPEEQEIFVEVNNVIKDLQNYILFLDHLIKYQPFQEYYKNPSHHKVFKKQSMYAKPEKDILVKKTYSEGGNRQDYCHDNIDLFTFELDENSPVDEGPQSIKQSKPMRDHLFENCQEHRDLFSQISSVKNQSLKSHQSSFFNSKSELGQLGQYFKNYPNISQADEHQFPNKKLLNDSDKQSSFNELKKLYSKIKEEKQDLIKEKVVFEKHYKKQIQTIENQHKKRINQMTIEFNDTLALLCQKTGLYFKKQKDKLTYSNSSPQSQISKDVYVQIDTSEQPFFRKRSQSKVQNEQSYQRLKQEYSEIDKNYKDKLQQKQSRCKQLGLMIEKSKQKTMLLQKGKEQDRLKIELLNILLDQKNFQCRKFKLKYQQDICQFINQIISKTSLHHKIIPATLFQNNRPFRKNSTSFPHNEVVATKVYQSSITLQGFIMILAQQFSVQIGQMSRMEMSERNVRQFVQRSVVCLQRRWLSVLRQKCEYLKSISVEDWYIEFEEMRVTYQLQKDVGEIIGLVQALIVKITEQRVQEEVSNLQINSFRADSQDAIQSQTDHPINSHQIENKQQPQIQPLLSKHSQQMAQIQYQHLLIQKNQGTIQDVNKGEVLPSSVSLQQRKKTSPQPQQMTMESYEMLIKEKEEDINSMQQELLTLRQQISKLKKDKKKGKFHQIEGLIDS